MGILTSSCQNHHLSTKSQLIESQSGKILPHVWAHRLPINSLPRIWLLGPLSVTHWSATSKFTVGNHWAFTVPERPIHSVLWRPSWKCGAAVAKHSKRQTPQKYWATGASPIARKTFPRVVHGVFNTQLLLRAWHERFLPSGWVWRITTHVALRHWLTQQLQINKGNKKGFPNGNPLNFGVADGARTHDNRNHNPGLYQLSYSHRRSENYNLAILISALNFSFNSL